MVKAGEMPDVLDLGTYWYDDPSTNSNGEFDCVIGCKSGLSFYECKYYKHPMSQNECAEEEKQVLLAPISPIDKIGFACTGGFEFTSDSYDLIDGEDLYSLLQQNRGA